MTTALDSFNEYMAAPCHELDERDAGRNDPHSQCFDEWGVPREMLFWLWEAAMRAAAQLSRALTDERIVEIAHKNVCVPRDHSDGVTYGELLNFARAVLDAAQPLRAEVLEDKQEPEDEANS